MINIKYNIVQTGPNIQLGGLKPGLAIVWYQPSTALKVANDPIRAVKITDPIETNQYLVVFFNFID